MNSIQSISNKIHQIHPERDWDRISAEKKLLIDFTKNKDYYSIIRLGDGELNILKQDGWLANQLANSVKQADLTGIPDDFLHNKRSHINNFDEQIIALFKNKYNHDIPLNKVFSSHLFLYTPDIVSEITQEKKVLWITAQSPKITNLILTNPDFNSFFDFNIKDSIYIDIPESSGPLPPQPYSNVYNNVINQLNKNLDFDIALIGAGVLGKLFCSYIKTDIKKQAVDIGCLMSAYKGIRNRLIFKPGGIRDFMIWR